MLGTPFVVIWLVGFIADLDIDSWLIKGIMYTGVWVAVQFLSKYVLFIKKNTRFETIDKSNICLYYQSQFYRT